MSTNDPWDQALRRAAPRDSTSVDTPQVHDAIVLPFAAAPARRRRRTALDRV